jgi:hypothetical protein
MHNPAKIQNDLFNAWRAVMQAGDLINANGLENVDKHNQDIYERSLSATMEAGKQVLIAYDLLKEVRETKSDSV